MKREGKVIPIFVGALGKSLEELEIRGRIKTIQTSDRLEYWEKSRRLEDTSCYSDSSEMPSVKTGVKKFANSEIEGFYQRAVISMEH